MAYSPSEKYPGAVDVDPDYQGGKFRDNNPSTTNNGSPLKAIDRNELLARDEAIMNDAGFKYNGLPDTPDDSQLFKAYKASLGNGANLLSNHNFLIHTPDDSQPLPSATPTSYPPGYQIFSGVFANETTGITNLTYIDGRVSFSGGDLYFAIPNTGAIARLTSDQLTSSVADFDGKPRTRGVSFALVGDDYRVTVGIDALEDVSANPTPLGSVKFEQGSVATRHDVSTHASTFESVDAMKSLANSTSGIVKTKSYRGGWAAQTEPIGGADYVISRLSNIRAAKGDPSWSPDGFIDHFIGGGSEFVAMFNDDSLNVTQAGADPYGNIECRDNIQSAIEYSYGSKLFFSIKNGRAIYNISSRFNIDQSIELVGSEKFNTSDVEFQSDSGEFLNVQIVNSFKVNGFKFITSAALTNTQAVVNLNGCTYYDVRNLNVVATLNNASNRVGRALQITEDPTRFNGYGYVEGINANDFDLPLNVTDVTNFRAARCSFNGLRQVYISGEIAYFEDMDISRWSEWGIFSDLTLSLVLTSTYTEHEFAGTYIKDNGRAKFGITNSGGKYFIRNSRDSDFIINKGDVNGVECVKGIANDGRLETANLLSYPNVDIDISDQFTPTGCVTKQIDSPQGACGSVNMDPALVSSTKDRQLPSPIRIGVGQNLSHSFYIKYVSGSDTSTLTISPSSINAGGADTIGEATLTASLFPIGEWVKVTMTTNQPSTSEFDVNYIRFFLAGDAVWRISKHNMCLGENALGSNVSNITSENGGVIYSPNVGMPNLPTSLPVVSGMLWNDGGTIKIS